MNHEDFLLENYNYTLPEDQIAQVPTLPEHQAKLLIIDEKNQYQNTTFRELQNLLSKNDLLLFNQTKVFKARIPLHNVKILRRSGEERIVEGEIFIYRLQDQNLECLVSDDKNFKPWAKIFFNDHLILESLEYTEQGILFSLEGMELFDFLEQYGEMPLPPYITYTKEKEQRYQTYFAENIWSAATPTASLHFTKELLEKFNEKQIPCHFFTLHVGLGTFKPVYVEDISKHPIHQETMLVEKKVFEIIYQRKKEKKNLIAVGTTMVRFLETLPYLRWYLSFHSDFSTFLETISPEVKEFWNELTKEIDEEKAHSYIFALKEQESFFSVETKLFIYPGFQFRIIDQIITNFHLPKSSLLMLVSAAMGRENALQCYQYAIEQGYKFYSFGDGMWIKSKTLCM